MQNALRRTMEAYSKVTRFCFICNYVSRIIEPLASRCAKFRFRPLHREVMSDRLHFICAKEGVVLQDEALGLLAQVAGGDLRKAVTTLQSAVRLGGVQVDRCVCVWCLRVGVEGAGQQQLYACRPGKLLARPMETAMCAWVAPR